MQVMYRSASNSSGSERTDTPFWEAKLTDMPAHLTSAPDHTTSIEFRDVSVRFSAVDFRAARLKPFHETKLVS